jgi:hypothetical protein
VSDLPNDILYLDTDAGTCAVVLSKVELIKPNPVNPKRASILLSCGHWQDVNHSVHSVVGMILES